MASSSPLSEIQHSSTFNIDDPWDWTESDGNNMDELMTEPINMTDENLASLLALADQIGQSSADPSTVHLSQPPEFAELDTPNVPVEEHVVPKRKAVKSRFVKMEESDLSDLAESKDSLRTKQQTTWAVTLLKRWLQERGQSIEFQDFGAEELDSLLRVFYVEVRTTEGKGYSKSVFVGIRSGLNRYLRNPPFEKTINILTDKEFHRSNLIFVSMLKKLKREENDVSTHHQPISDGDMSTLQNYLCQAQKQPSGLLQKVWFDLTWRGNENQRNLKRESFLFKVDDTGREYVELGKFKTTYVRIG